MKVFRGDGWNLTPGHWPRPAGYFRLMSLTGALAGFCFWVAIIILRHYWRAELNSHQSYP
jgi:hypothetical protein